MDIFFSSLKDGISIAVFVLVSMIAVDYLDVLTKGKIRSIMKGGIYRQYLATSFLGATPGCLGSFMNASFYVHGMISFGALLGGMIATCGDEAFVMFAMFPGKAAIVVSVLFIMGFVFGYIVDKIFGFFNIKLGAGCQVDTIHVEDKNFSFELKNAFIDLKKISFLKLSILCFLILFTGWYFFSVIGSKEWDIEKISFVSFLCATIFIVITMSDHYVKEHIWKHIIKKHLGQIFFWSFCSLWVINLALNSWNLEIFVRNHMMWVLLIASIIALIPVSGPHLIFVVMFAKGLVPFSVLIVSSFIQDGHGLLPVLSYSIKDAVLVKSIKLVIGLGIGTLLYVLGL